MSFVRVKEIYGSEYGYLVVNSWTERGSRQKVGKYLGKIYRPKRVKSESLAAFLSIADIRGYIKQKPFKTLASDLVRLELKNHSIKSEDFDVDMEGCSVRKGKKEVVLALNDGFLCAYTLKLLLEYNPGEDYSGYLLADLLTGAGLMPEQEVFISLYGKFKATYEAAAARKFEFYY